MIDMKTSMEKEDYTLIGKEKVGKKIKFKYICSNGHIGSIRKDHWGRGVRCPHCAGNARLDIEFVRKSFLDEGYTLLNTVYKNSKQILNTICPAGHKYNISWNNWSRGYRCSICSGRAKINIDSISCNISESGYKLLSNSYINNKEKIELLCPNGHIYKVSWDNWSNKNSRCPRCGKNGTSKVEEELASFVGSMCGDIIRFDRELAAPYEIDIVVPDKKIAIEYCGLYWHSELMGKGRRYHLNKKECCNKKGYNLVTIFEDEYVSKKEIVMSRIRSLLGSIENKIYARECSVRSISYFEASEFCNKNHLQGYGIGASVYIGAFYKGDLVGVMTFSIPSVAKGYNLKNRPLGLFELSRYCVKINCVVVGLFSKFIKFFTNKFKPGSIISYADYRWSNGKVYEKAGFKLLYLTQPNYWYFKNNKKRLHRFALRKKKGEPNTSSEWSLRQSQGWNRIWDCGSLKYILEKV
ncbi:MAG: hypothetical protein DRI61_08675 [Chloroflexi bacterium]|nr:MAG: hypothetical protein DRI61_08675 [Chloroflexota bacterium]